MYCLLHYANSVPKGIAKPGSQILQHAMPWLQTSKYFIRNKWISRFWLAISVFYLQMTEKPNSSWFQCMREFSGLIKTLPLGCDLVISSSVCLCSLMCSAFSCPVLIPWLWMTVDFIKHTQPINWCDQEDEMWPLDWINLSSHSHYATCTLCFGSELRFYFYYAFSL